MVFSHILPSAVGSICQSIMMHCISNFLISQVEKPSGSQRKGCLWALNPAKIAKMKEEVQKWKRKDPESIRRSMSNPGMIHHPRLIEH